MSKSTHLILKKLVLNDFHLKESITSGFTGRQKPFPADLVQPLVRRSFHQYFSNSEKGISFRNPFLP